MSFVLLQTGVPSSDALQFGTSVVTLIGAAALALLGALGLVIRHFYEAAEHKREQEKKDRETQDREIVKNRDAIADLQDRDRRSLVEMREEVARQLRACQDNERELRDEMNRWKTEVLNHNTAAIQRMTDMLDAETQHNREERSRQHDDYARLAQAVERLTDRLSR